MYVGTRIKWIDQSNISSVVDITTVDNPPLYCAAFAADKGTEDWVVMSGQDWFDMYGDPSFSKYGQASLQTAQCIASGAQILCKRVVANDATLANLAIYAKVVESTASEIYTTEEELAAAGLESDAGVVTVTYCGVSFEDCLNLEAVKECAEEQLATYKSAAAEGESYYLLYLFTDNGRGTSSKRITIECNYTLSKTSTYPIYKIYIRENGYTLSSHNFTINPYYTADQANISLAAVLEDSTEQIKAVQYEDEIEAYTNQILEVTGISSAGNYDLMFGCTGAGKDWSQVIIDTSSDGAISLSRSIGNSLQNGSNGSFGDNPMSTEEVIVELDDGSEDIYIPYDNYTQALLEAFDGTFDNCIYDLDRYYIEFIFDANYPDSVKEAISELASFRQDFYFFRDIGIGKDSLNEIKNACTEACNTGADDFFTGLYCQDYMIRDPYTYRRVNVTMVYSIAIRMVELLDSGYNNPIAGIRYNMVFDEVLTNTLNWCPVYTPDINEKEEMDDIRMNYGCYIGSDFVLESEYTANPTLTQLSYANNIIAVQKVLHEIRKSCPKNRYAFITEEDLDDYKTDVQAIINTYDHYFNTITFEYMEDAAYENNKIFYAVIKVSFYDFIQSEYFEIIAINADAAATTDEDEE